MFDDRASATMNDRTQLDLVERQFGSQAENYFNSAVHARGADLEALVASLPTGVGKALDLGCGPGHVSFAAAPHVGELVAYDVSAEMLKIVSATAAAKSIANIRTRQGPVERLPFVDGAFDCVLSRFSAHHWDFSTGLREASRVTRAGGVVAMADVVSSGAPLFDTWLQTLELLRDPSHVRDHSRAEWIATAADAGLRAERMQSFPLRLDFLSWIERMRTPDVFVAAIRGLQAAASRPVADYFLIEPDGSFTIEVALFCFVKA